MGASPRERGRRALDCGQSIYKKRK